MRSIIYNDLYNLIILRSFEISKTFNTDADWLQTELEEISGYKAIGGFAYSNQPSWIIVTSCLFPYYIGYKRIISNPCTCKIAGTVIYLKSDYIGK